MFGNGPKIWKTAGVIAAALWALSPNATAATSDHVMFEAAPSAFFEVVESGDDFKTILVATNTPFEVMMEGVIGEIDVELSTTGTVNGRAYGSRAQAPGDYEQSVTVTSMLKTVVYEADQQTALHRGTLRQQAVQLTISHNALADPKISILAQR